jgi:hypothetical protein
MEAQGLLQLFLALLSLMQVAVVAVLFQPLLQAVLVV